MRTSFLAIDTICGGGQAMNIIALKMFSQDIGNMSTDLGCKSLSGGGNAI
jgi:hypothetical protein